ncbi:MAG: hypothetical protein AAGF88_07985 [Pseudomonadota bacterium]
MRLFIATLFAFCTHPAFAQDYVFEWTGSGGYSMRGAMSFPLSVGKGILTEAQVQCFEIEGFLDGAPIGRWALEQLTEETTWQLNFDPEAQRFLTASAELPVSQAWNMDGGGENCGDDGFGFNLGDFAQDLCLDNSLLVESQVPPSTPFPATEVFGHVFSPDACFGAAIMSRGAR